MKKKLRLKYVHYDFLKRLKKNKYRGIFAIYRLKRLCKYDTSTVRYINLITQHWCWHNLWCTSFNTIQNHTSDVLRGFDLSTISNTREKNFSLFLCRTLFRYRGRRSTTACECEHERESAPSINCNRVTKAHKIFLFRRFQKLVRMNSKSPRNPLLSNNQIDFHQVFINVNHYRVSWRSLLFHQRQEQ